MRPFCIRDLAEVLGGRLQLGALPPLAGDLEPLGRITLDVHDVQPGDIYWALPKTGCDKVCLEEAFARSALGVVAAGRRIEPWAGKFAIDVEDPGLALQRLLNHRRQQLTGPLIAVAGAAGKTTTAHWIHAALRAHWTGTFCSRPSSATWPLQLLDLCPESHYGLVELGGATTSQQATVASRCRPDIAVVVQGSDASASASANTIESGELHELFSSLAPNGWLILNGDEPELRRFAATKRAQQVLTVGRGSHCDLIASDICFRDGWLSLRVDGDTLSVPAWGRHHLHSVLAAYAAGRIHDLSHQELAASLRHFRPAVGACQVVHTPTVTLVADRSRHRPSAVRAALEVLREINVAGRRVVVCGDPTFEENASPDLFRAYGESIVARCGADLLIGVGAAGEAVVAAALQSGMANRQTISCTSSSEAIAELRSWLRAGDAVLISAHDERELDGWIQSLTPLTITAAA